MDAKTCICGTAVIRVRTPGHEEPEAFTPDAEGAWRLDPERGVMHRDAEYRWGESVFRYRLHSCVEGAS